MVKILSSQIFSWYDKSNLPNRFTFYIFYILVPWITTIMILKLFVLFFHTGYSKPIVVLSDSSTNIKKYEKEKVTCDLSPVLRQLSHVTCHLTHVTRHAKCRNPNILHVCMSLDHHSMQLQLLWKSYDFVYAAAGTLVTDM